MLDRDSGNSRPDRLLFEALTQPAKREVNETRIGDARLGANRHQLPANAGWNVGREIDFGDARSFDCDQNILRLTDNVWFLGPPRWHRSQLPKVRRSSEVRNAIASAVMVGFDDVPARNDFADLAKFHTLPSARQDCGFAVAWRFLLLVSRHHANK